MRIAGFLRQGNYLVETDECKENERRSPEEQDALYAQGRTEPGKVVTNAKRWQSMHSYGLAIDVFFIVEGKASWAENLFLQLWFAACKEGLDRRGLHWSGIWTGSLRESAHFQLKKPDWRECAKTNGIDPITLNHRFAHVTKKES